MSAQPPTITEKTIATALSGLLPGHPVAHRVITSLWAHYRARQPESPEEEGRRLFVEGVALSDLYARVSGQNFVHFREVVGAFHDAHCCPNLLSARARAIAQG